MPKQAQEAKEEKGEQRIEEEKVGERQEEEVFKSTLTITKETVEKVAYNSLRHQVWRY